MKPMLRASRYLRQHKDIYAGHGAFNVNGPLYARAAVNTAERLRAPLILQGSDGANGFNAGVADFRNATVQQKQKGAKIIADSVKQYGEDSEVPISLHLDHGKDFESVKAAIDAGYTSVMIDASSKSLEDNITLTKKVVDYARRVGKEQGRYITVEAEIGELKGMEDWVNVEKSTYTRIKDAVRLIAETGIDALAISYGTSHGAFKGNVKVKKEIATGLYEIVLQEGLDCELVSHGSSSVHEYLINEIKEQGGKFEKVTSGVSVSQLQEVIRGAISKINVDTDIRLAITRNVWKYFNEHKAAQTDALTGGIWKLMQNKPDKFDPRYYLVPALDQIIKDDRSNPYMEGIMEQMEAGVQEIVGERILQFGGGGLAAKVLEYAVELKEIDSFLLP